MAQNKMRVWIEAATREELERLGSISKRTVATIRQIAGGYRTEGAARTTPEVARDIEIATIKMQRPGLPAVYRESLCPACAKCEHQRNAKAVQNGKG